MVMYGHIWFPQLDVKNTNEKEGKRGLESSSYLLWVAVSYVCVLLLVFVTVAYQWTHSTSKVRTFLQSEDILVPQLQRTL